MTFHLLWKKPAAGVSNSKNQFMNKNPVRCRPAGLNGSSLLSPAEGEAGKQIELLLISRGSKTSLGEDAPSMSEDGTFQFDTAHQTTIEGDQEHWSSVGTRSQSSPRKISSLPGLNAAHSAGTHAFETEVTHKLVAGLTWSTPRYPSILPIERNFQSCRTSRGLWHHIFMVDWRLQSYEHKRLPLWRIISTTSISVHSLSIVAANRRFLKRKK